MRDEFISSNVQVIEDIKNKYNMSDDEINIIYDGMDKYDYKSELKNSEPTPRYIDFDKILIETYAIKKKYTQWKLTNVQLGSSQDSFPPRNSYSYKFKDDSGNIFKL